MEVKAVRSWTVCMEATKLHPKLPSFLNSKVCFCFLELKGDPLKSSLSLLQRTQHTQVTPPPLVQLHGPKPASPPK